MGDLLSRLDFIFRSRLMWLNVGKDHIGHTSALQVLKILF